MNNKNKKGIPPKDEKIKTKKESKEVPHASYAHQFKQKQELSKSNIENSNGSVMVKGGINFDDLEDWNELDYKDKSII